MFGTSAAEIIKRLSFSSVSPTSARSSTMSYMNLSSTSAILLSTTHGTNGAAGIPVPQHIQPMSSNATTAASVATASSTDNSSSKVQVCLRIKPCDNKVETIKVLDDSKVRATPPPGALPTFKTTEYSFSRVFSPEANQAEVFEHVAAPLITGLLDSGKDGLIFAYGVTNSGKTFTVEGNRENPGLVPQTLQRIFKVAPQSVVFVSYLQIYNDQVHDLQEAIPHPTPNNPIPPERKNLKVKLRDDRVIVDGLKETRVTSLAEGMAILDRGRENRTISDNSINQSSSRSHTVFIIRIGQSKLHIVDLAGSERGKRTKATGVRQVEASNINLSLSQLMQCLDAMRANQKLARLYPDKPRDKPPFRPIPFRDCKLTMLFRDCLRGRNSAGVVMVVNASPEPNDFEETTQALRYGEMTRSTAIEASNAANNLLAMAAAVAGTRYDYNGRLIRGGGAAENNKAVVTNDDEEVEDVKNGEKNALLQLPPLPPLLRSAVKQVTATTSFASPPVDRVAYHHEEDPLATENEQLRAQLAEVRTALVTQEMRIRNELATEMAHQLKEMEDRYNERLARAQSLRDNSPHPYPQRSIQSQVYTAENFKLMEQLVRDNEEEMDRMREKHKRDLEALQTELNNARRAQIEASLHQQTQNAHQQVRRDVPSTPWMVAEERKRVDRLMRDLEDEKEAHRQVILERAELQHTLEKLTNEQRELRNKEESLMLGMETLVKERDAARNTIVVQVKQLQQLRSRVASPSQCSAQLSGVAPHLLLSKSRNKENYEFGVLRSKENNEVL